jgi:hypothetical protein
MLDTEGDVIDNVARKDASRVTTTTNLFANEYAVVLEK